MANFEENHIANAKHATDAVTALGFSVEEARLALERCDSDPERAARLLLTLLAPASDEARATLFASGDGIGRKDDLAIPHIEAYVARALKAAEEGEPNPDEDSLQEELLVLESIFGDNFSMETRLGRTLAIRLRLPDLLPVPGELHLRMQLSGRYPHTPPLPAFLPSNGLTLGKPGACLVLNRRLAEKALALAEEQAPAGYELSTWLEEAIPELLGAPADAPLQRLPPLLEVPKALRERQRRAKIAADHLGAAWSATHGLAKDEAEAEAKGIGLEEHLRQTALSSTELPSADNTSRV